MFSIQKSRGEITYPLIKTDLLTQLTPLSPLCPLCPLCPLTH